MSPVQASEDVDNPKTPPQATDDEAWDCTSISL